MEIKSVLGLLSIIIVFFGYIPYFRDVLQKKTKPHIFTWLVWTVLSGIAFSIQLTNNGGPGAWIIGFSAVATFVIFLLSFKDGEKNIVLLDWISLFIAGISLLLWFFTKTPLFSILLITLMDIVGGYVPTFRKSFNKPHEETLSLYVVYVVSLGLSLMALQKFDIINAIYPLCIIVANIVMITFLCVRRRSKH